MAQQEIGVRLKADTQDAVRSVKELEQHISGMEGLEKKGNAAEGFLSRKDVDEFKRMSAEAEQVHRSFQEKLDRSARELEAKRSQMSKAQQSGADPKDISALRGEVDDLTKQRDMYERSSQRAQEQMSRHEQTTSTVSDYRTEHTGVGGNIYAMGAGTLGGVAGMVGGAFALSQMTQGMGLIKSEEAQAAQLGQRIEGVDGDYLEFRRQAADTGRLDGNAYNTQETFITAEQYSSLAGAENAEELMSMTREIQTGSRAMGLDPNLLASSYGSVAQMGGLDTSTVKSFQEGMIGAIKETGMDGRDAEFTQAVTGLADQVSRGQMEFGNAELNQILGLQTLLGQSGEPGLQGQRGADVLGSIDSAVKGDDNRLDIMLGWGTEFTGLEGRAELERLKAGGIGDPEVMQRLMTNIEGSFGGDKDMMALFMKESFGISMEQADALLSDDIYDQLKEGSMDPDDLARVVEEGSTEMTDRTGDWSESEAQTRASNDAEMEETKKALGFIPDQLFEGFKDWFTDLPTIVQAGGIVGAGAGGIGMLGGLFGNLAPKVGDILGKGGKNGAGGILGDFTKNAQEMGKKGKGLLKGGSRALGPAAGLLTANSLVDSGIDSMGDWLFGYEEGDIKREHQGGGFFADETLTDPRLADEADERYKEQESRKGLLGRTWDWITGSGDDDLPDGGGAMTEELPRSVTDSDIGQGPMVNGEGHVVNARRALLAQQADLLEREKKNIDEQKGLLGLGGFGTSAMMGLAGDGSGGGGGILGALFGGILEGIMGGDDGSGGSAAVDGGDLTQQSLKASNTMSAEEIDDWINSKAPSDSVLRGQGAAFAKAAQESGLDARYLVSHAAHETAWGTSNIAKNKGNMYGIGAFDASPYASAYGYNNTEAGIVEGAKWIAENYTNKGQDTLHSMRHNDGTHEYATDPQWHTKIANIMKGASGFGGGAETEYWGGGAPSTQRIEVVVSGSIDNLTAENNDQVTDALRRTLLEETSYNLGSNYRQGVGGDR